MKRGVAGANRIPEDRNRNVIDSPTRAEKGVVSGIRRSGQRGDVGPSIDRRMISLRDDGRTNCAAWCHGENSTRIKHKRSGES
mmetsp:Transcript_19067/g.26640  ORF Transcript_19067/g.26640 Transcript_19067/m.26640 type:complete len:83 (+) Transcript_19067:1002-1250(+)